MGAHTLRTYRLRGTRILLIRHASTDPGGRLCGWLDIGLSPAGHAELADLLRRVQGQPAPDALLTSTLRRASEVGAALGRAWNLAPQPADWAREIHCGELEGVRLEDIKRRFNDLWNRNEAQDDDTFAWPGGESYADFRSRIVRGLDAVAAAHPGGRVALVTHAGVISQIIGLSRGRPAAAWAPDRPGPLTATEIVWKNDAPATVLTFNEVAWDSEAQRRA
jgi:broad specificity phosphatase PhoE